MYACPKKGRLLDSGRLIETRENLLMLRWKRTSFANPCLAAATVTFPCPLFVALGNDGSVRLGERSTFSDQQQGASC